ncbi:hypothetical protein [Haloarchaeobius sp. DT45]|uniref:hypothetical protein n=1 Tax=Haloarchaeobius sp. DT45 TaxID=3446116 RepID=UPI003F6D672B
MVEVTVELLASIAVTVLLMLVFLGVVVAWDIALALRDVAEKIDSLEDDVDEDLGEVDGTLTRIHDRMSELAAAHQQRFEGARNAQAEYQQGDRHGTDGRQAQPHGRAMNPQSPYGAPDAPAPGRPTTHSAPTPAVGVGSPGRRPVGTSVGRTGNQRWSPDTSIGGFQMTDRSREHKEADSRGVDAAEVAVVSSSEDTSDHEFDGDDEDDDVDASSPDPDETGAGDATGDESADDEASEDSVETGDGGDDDEAVGEDGSESGDSPVEHDPAESVDGDGEVVPDSSAVADADPADGTVTDGDDQTVTETESDGVSPNAAEDEEDTTADDQSNEEPDQFNEKADQFNEKADQFNEKADQSNDDSAYEELEPDRSAAQAVQNFGHDAQTNRGFSPMRTSDPGPGSDDGSAAEETGGDPDDGQDEDTESTHAAPATRDASANVGRFADETLAEDEEPWYQTALDRDGVATDQPEPTIEREPAGDGPQVDESTPDDARTSSDGGTLAATAAPADTAAEVDAVEAAAASVLSALDDEAVEPDTPDASASDDEVLETSDAVDTAGEIADGELDDEELDGELDDDDGAGDDGAGDDGAGDDGAGDDGEQGIADLVNQELNSLTQQVGGTSLAPDVSEMSLRQATTELDDTSYDFPLSGQSFDVTATAEQEVATLRFTPVEELDLSGARERLLRYQLRNYLDDAETSHAEVLVDGADLVLEIPGATAETLDTWVDAMIQIVDRTLYLTAGDD